MSPETFERERLSAREDAILEAAIEGLTDVQISLRLEISQSTVNSYWVRIRGKLGQLSRTELVALALKSKALSEMGAMHAQLAELREAVRKNAWVSDGYSNSETYRAALDAMPEPMLVACHEGLVRYANSRLESIFGYEESELIDQPVSVLFPAQRNSSAGRIEEILRAPHPLRVGVDSVLYARRKNGTLFRVIVLVDSRPTSKGAIASLLVRDFATEIETRREFAASM